MSNPKNSYARAIPRAAGACDYRDTRKTPGDSNPTKYMTFVLLAIFLVFWTQDLISEPLENKPVAYVEESSGQADSDKSLPGPEDPVAVDRPPELIEAPAPGYPLDALKVGKSGTVRVKALVDTKGRVRKAIIEKPSGEEIGFEEAALEAAFKRIYRPAEFENKPVAVWVSYEVSFELKNE
ncbi:MAG TPA: energy transducer TonB [candidate division Zixibacteria bacterium]|nr:energy transducer TonB [candidate division Zixibacteria bacterium]